MTAIFNTDQIKDTSVKRQYDYMLERSRNLYDIFSNTYLDKSQNKKIQIDYEFSYEFQASADKTAENLYSINMHSPVLLMLRNLFDALLASDQIGGTVCGKISKSFSLKLPLILDIRNPLIRKNIEVKTDLDRTFVSSILTDFTGTFIMIHEIGHIVSGHVDYVITHFKENKVLEVFDKPKNKTQKEIDLRQSMEFDADMIAARLIPQYIEQLYNKIQEDKRYQKAFNLIYNSNYLMESLIALCLGALFNLFVYSAGKFAILGFENSYHPHPLTRSQYIKNAVIQTLKERHQLDQGFLIEHYLNHIDNIMISLEKWDMLNYDLFDKEYFDNSDSDMDRIQKIAFENRKNCQKWSWLSEKEWD